MPDAVLRKVSDVFAALRSVLLSRYAAWPSLCKGIRFCDFVISRSGAYRFIEFELSNICNARCVFCPYPDMLKSGKKFMHMSRENLERDMAYMRYLRPGLISFTPTTGDTLLHPQWDVYMQDVLKLDNIKRAMMYTNAIELGPENIEKFRQILCSAEGGKLTQICFSLGGPDAAAYRELYQVDRFDEVRSNIAALMTMLSENQLYPGVYVQVKLAHGRDMSLETARRLFNPAAYPFAYYSFSKSYFSNDAYTRNALVDYRSAGYKQQKSACAYLGKTRFAADGGIWADGCVISELPGDSSLRLGDNTMPLSAIEENRQDLIKRWEKQGDIPLPCRGCTMYRPRD